MEERNVRQWIEAFDNGEFSVEGERPSSYSYKYGEYVKHCYEVACDAGWYDWFCKDHALIGRIKRYAPLIKALAKVNPGILEGYTVGFKQTLPLAYKGFNDCVHIYALGDDDDRGWGIYVSNPRREHRYEVFRYGTWHGTDFVCDSLKELKQWFAQEVA